MRGGRLFVGRIVVAFAALALATAGLAACGGGDSTPRTDVDLRFSEWEIAVEPAQVPAGEITFNLTNSSEVTHQLVVVKSDLPPGELPRNGDTVDKSRLNVVGSAASIPPGPPAKDAEGYSIELSPGKYVLFCDVVTNGESHYRNGMYASLLVGP